jgi:hypothetical protein
VMKPTKLIDKINQAGSSKVCFLTISSQYYRYRVGKHDRSVLGGYSFTHPDVSELMSKNQYQIVLLSFKEVKTDDPFLTLVQTP